MALPGRRVGNFAGFLVCTGLMGYALYAQHVLYYDPCPLCILQRIAVIALGLVFLLAALHNPGDRGARVYAVLLAIPGLYGIGVAGWHVYKQLQPPDPMASCGPGLDYMLETFPFSDVLRMIFTGSGDCTNIDWRFLGLSMPAWVLIALVALTVLGIWNNLRRTARDSFLRA